MPEPGLVELAGLLPANGGIGAQPEVGATVLDRQLRYHGMTATRTVIPHR